MATGNNTGQLDLCDFPSKLQSKDLGQFFTQKKVADYMASMLHIVEDVNQIRVLDAGAGTGALTVSTARRCMELGYRNVHAVLYEIDERLLSTLNKNMQQVSGEFVENGGTFSYEVLHQDFVLSRPDRRSSKFHISIINPPYFKYSASASVYSGTTSDLFRSDPNIYASFMAVVCSCLVSNGQMVAIVPRSFTNGLYFRGFRSYLRSQMSLEKVHIFRARNRLFKDMGVLQENIICKYVKDKQRRTIEVRSSTCSEDIDRSEVARYSSELIIKGGDQQNVIRIPENSDDGRILYVAEDWPSSFEENDYSVSTGPVVEFRVKEYITSTPQTEAIPLIRMHNVKPFRTEWTGRHKKDVCFLLKQGYKKHTSNNEVYVLLKRFSSKDERRRLVAGINDPHSIKSKLIGFENHLNYIGIKGRKMELVEAFGLAALFNSTFVDRYFRSISGNTQVNATEIRMLKLPTRKQVIRIGKEIQKNRNFEQSTVDQIVESVLDLCIRL